MKPETAPEAPVAGVPDASTTPLATLAGAANPATLRHVLPAEEPKRLAVCAFGSSI